MPFRREGNRQRKGKHRPDQDEHRRVIPSDYLTGISIWVNECAGKL
jgi:hypothetical protein